MPSSFSGCLSIPSEVTRCPRNEILVAPNLHFSGFHVSPCLCGRSKTLSGRHWCSSVVFENTTISSRYTILYLNTMF